MSLCIRGVGGQCGASSNAPQTMAQLPRTFLIDASSIDSKYEQKLPTWQTYSNSYIELFYAVANQGQ